MRSALLSISEIALPSRYELLLRLAAGGTATVHVGRLRGIAGFWRLVAVKVAHPHLIEDPEHRETMVEEARMASQIHHPNVVPVIDIDDVDGRMLLVMDYIEGASLADLVAASRTPIPPRIALRVALDACAGLHAAHNLRDGAGRRLRLVHRDVSPHNLLIGSDGVTRLTDFGIAKTSRMRGRTGAGALKGKLAYMAPEYVTGHAADACSDVFGLGVVVWEMLAGRRLFRGESEHDTLCNVLHVEAPSLLGENPALSEDVAAVIGSALAKEPSERFTSARAFAAALETAARRADLIATTDEVAAFVMARVGSQLMERRKRIAELIAAAPPASAGAAPAGLGMGAFGAEQTVSGVRLGSLPASFVRDAIESPDTLRTGPGEPLDAGEMTAGRDEITRRDVPSVRTPAAAAKAADLLAAVKVVTALPAAPARPVVTVVERLVTAPVTVATETAATLTPAPAKAYAVTPLRVRALALTAAAKAASEMPVTARSATSATPVTARPAAIEEDAESAAATRALPILKPRNGRAFMAVALAALLFGGLVKLCLPVSAQSPAPATAATSAEQTAIR